MKKTATKISLTDEEIRQLSLAGRQTPEEVANCRVKDFLKKAVTLPKGKRKEKFLPAGV